MTATEVLRRFNRTYTQRIGALDESFLGLGLPLGASRLVFEIGETGTTVLGRRERMHHQRERAGQESAAFALRLLQGADQQAVERRHERLGPRLAALRSDPRQEALHDPHEP